MSGHSPMFGILSPGSLVRIREVPGDDNPGDAVRAAVRDGFLSVTANRVSILASAGVLATDVDAPAAQAELDDATAAAGSAAAAEESVEVRYARARLRAAGDQA
jgi:F-type H+-transporting ATPase subunit epsilon